MGDGDDSFPEYPAVTVESSSAQIDAGFSPARVRAGMRKRKNWEQLFKFCVVGVTGYAVNLAVFASLVQGFSFHYIPAAMASFLVAVTNNYTWNRIWTFRHQRGDVAYQGARFFVVSSLALARQPCPAGSARLADVPSGLRAGDRDRARHAGELRRQ